MGLFATLHETVAALYVQADGIYSKDFGVNIKVWALPHKDARTYAGPHPVVAHPPCQRWGRFATGAFKHKGKYKLGDDGGCFEAALSAVRKYGGVLEHPANSKAWKHFGIKHPPKQPGVWIKADEHGGYTCLVYQGNYGHQAIKPTWLYAVPGDNNEGGLHYIHKQEKPEVSIAGKSPSARKRAEKEGNMTVLSVKDREATPQKFAEALLDIAASSNKSQ